jgi:hypothetical protein
MFQQQQSGRFAGSPPRSFPRAIIKMSVSFLDDLDDFIWMTRRSSFSKNQQGTSLNKKSKMGVVGVVVTRIQE